jgi:hypothetical protein
MTMAATTTASAAASASVVAHAATAADLPFIAGLFAASNERDELGIGYPRCDDAGELLAELALYNASLEDSFHVLRLADGQRVGALGFLFDDDMPFAYVAGPLLDGGARHTGWTMPWPAPSASRAAGTRRCATAWPTETAR